VCVWLVGCSSVDPNDILQALGGIWPVTLGRPCVPAALRSLPRAVFPRGGRLGTDVSSIAVLVTDADTPFDYSDWVQAAEDAREEGNIELYIVSVGSGPYRVAMETVARDADHVIDVPTAGDVTTAAGRMLDRLCSN